MRRVVIVRGLPGSGKTTYIRSLQERAGETGVEAPALVCSPDRYFYRTGEYIFEKAKIGEAHAHCRITFARALKAGLSPIYLDYVFIERWQYEDYECVADLAGYEVSIIEMNHDRASLPLFAERNKHGVPIEVIKGMAKKWTPDPRATLIDGCD